MSIDIEPTAPVELENVRLQALVSTVFEDGHYNHACGCKDCTETRRFLDPPDLEFIDTLSRTIHTSDLNTRPRLTRPECAPAVTPAPNT